MRRLITGAVLLAVAVLTLGVAACGDDDDDTDGATSQATTPASGGSEDTVEVDAADFSFDPDAFTVAAAQDVTVTLDNAGAVTHTLTVYTDEEFTDPVDGADTGNVSAGTQGEFTASFDAGEFYFRCEIHPTQMQGEFQAE